MEEKQAYKKTLDEIENALKKYITHYAIWKNMRSIMKQMK